MTQRALRFYCRRSESQAHSGFVRGPRITSESKTEASPWRSELNDTNVITENREGALCGQEYAILSVRMALNTLTPLVPGL